uniref:testis-specific serine/threonine-protein kinase 6-like n=1 Tax=Centroberyx gerrardi TaxID=166262 RepID=UPI003AAC9C39
MTNRVLSALGYEVERVLGEGAYSKVKLASSQNHGHKVAIKILDRRTAPRDFVQRFLPREVDILKTVKHDNIIRVYEFIEFCDRKLCIVMECAETDLLYKIQEVGRFPVDQSRAMFAQMVNAVSYLHQNNIVHRDLKCENVLLMGNQVKISDFGFARIAMESTELSKTYCGSAAYAPPEVLRGIPYDPKKHDIWSMGVILYAMVTGCLPYDDSNVARLPKIQRRPVKYPEVVELPESCRAFISFLLHFNPCTRPSIQEVAQHSWLEKAGDHNKAVTQ